VQAVIMFWLVRYWNRSHHPWRCSKTM